jgi:hypothetical protein
VIAEIAGQEGYQYPFEQYAGAVSPTVDTDMGLYLMVDYPTRYWQGGDAGYFNPNYYVTGLGFELMTAQFGVDRTLDFQARINHRFYYDANAAPCHADPCPAFMYIIEGQAASFFQSTGMDIKIWMENAHQYIARRHAGEWPTLADVGLTRID